VNAAYFDTDGSGQVDVTDLMNLLSVYGAVVPVPFVACGDPMTYQGYAYATVQIGDQCWFAENLRNDLYANGDSIPANLSDEAWMDTSNGATTTYGEDAGCSASAPDFDACDPSASLEAYGRLYNWYAVVDGRGLCPSGWHTPSDTEWMDVEMALGMSEADAGSTFWRGTDQGDQMKATTGWADDGNGTNTSGMTLKPGGYRYGFDEAEFVIAGNFASCGPLPKGRGGRTAACSWMQVPKSNANKNQRNLACRSAACRIDPPSPHAAHARGARPNARRVDLSLTRNPDISVDRF
jgi:uncharacterized protein (TIGR02145 family)